MNSPKVAAFFASVSTLAVVLLFSVLVLDAQPPEPLAELPDRFSADARYEIGVERPGGRFIKDYRIYRRCEDSNGRLVGGSEGNENGDPNDGRFIEYRPDGTKWTWTRIKAVNASTWCWRS